MKRCTLRLVTSLALTTPLATAASAGGLFVKPSGTGTTCSQSAPCTLATALASAAEDDEIFVAAGTYTGTGSEVVLLEETVHLLGGWNGSPSGAVVRDPIANQSVLDGQNARRVLAIVDGEPTIDGFTITRGNASGQVSNCWGLNWTPSGCGGGVFVLSAGGTLSNNLFVGNRASTSSTNLNEAGYGGALYSRGAKTLVVRGNTFRDNVASTANGGFGGAVGLAKPIGPVTVEANRFQANHGTTAAGAWGWGGAIGVNAGAHASVDITRNVCAGDRASQADGGDSNGNAIYVYDSEPMITGNFVTSNWPYSAVMLERSGGGIHRNTIIAGAESYALYLYEGAYGGASVTSNVVAGGSSATFRAHAEPSHPLDLQVYDNTFVSNPSGRGVLIENDTTADLQNTIVAGHKTGVMLTGNGLLTMDRTLFFNNESDGMLGTNPLHGDPMFVNAAAGDFHIQPGSAAAGAGSGYGGVVLDIDGEARPGLGGIDIGADELAPSLFDFGTATSPVASSWTQVTAATAYSPTLGFGWSEGHIDERDRGVVDALRRDFNFTRDGTFSIDLPSGRYFVALQMGDRIAPHDQMGVSFEDSQAGVVTTSANSFSNVTFPVHVADGRLTARFEDLGGSDVNVVVNSLDLQKHVVRKVDLGVPGSPAASGWTAIHPSTSFGNGPGEGWIGGDIQGRDRGGASALSRDFNFTGRGLFGAFIHNGIYDVVATLGDAAHAHDMMGVSVQGAVPDQVDAAKNQFVTRHYRTTVSDNRLELLLEDLGGSDANAVLNALEIAPPPLLYFDFGTDTSPLASGYLRVTHTTGYSSDLRYGWSSGAVGSRDRGTGVHLYRDFNFTADGTFLVDLLNGRYTVTLAVGDASYGHDEMGIYLEGVLVDTLTQTAGGTATRSYAVVVTDGQLTVRLADLGGFDAFVVVNALTIR